MNKNFRHFKSRKEFMVFVSNSKDLIPKEKLICELCQDKDVLDIGCIDHSYETAMALGENWLHKQLRDVAKSIIGLDILGEDVRKLNERGFNIVEGNAECFNFNRTFDVIVAGDIIEHLSNIGLFLECSKAHMHQDSICIITTPNPFNVEQTMLAIFHNSIMVNQEHATWLDPQVMYETVSRAELDIVDFHWIETRFKMPISKFPYSTLINGLSRIIMKKRPICRRDYAIVLKKPIKLK